MNAFSYQVLMRIRFFLAEAFRLIMDALLDSHFDLDSRDTYSPASKCSSALPHQPSRSPRYDQYEIGGLK
jgi:hypothetical protein